jgi:hypothetical protein
MSTAFRNSEDTDLQVAACRAAKSLTLDTSSERVAVREYCNGDPYDRGWGP